MMKKNKAALFNLIKEIVDKTGKNFADTCNEVAMKNIKLLSDAEGYDLINWELNVIVSVNATLINMFWMKVKDTEGFVNAENFIYQVIDAISTTFLTKNEIKPEGKSHANYH